MSQRLTQIANLIQRNVQMIISRGLHDPRIRGLVSVTEVELAPDMSQCTVRVSIVPEEHAALTVKGLRAASKHMRSEVAGQVKLRKMPRLDFVLDDSLKRAARVHAALADVVPEGQDVQNDEATEERRPEDQAL
ncbi:MAG: 30S ribosome-binding factor RbfA [Phycisphaerales bacterium]|nr:30S ribosome-binding factor RbfA [Phycisphaerales bacterium]